MWPSDKVLDSMVEVDVYHEILAEEGTLDNEVLIAGLILLERYLSSLKTLCPINFDCLIAVACYVAQKVVLDTDIWAASDYGIISGLEAEMLKQLEIEFLNDLEFKVHIKAEEFSRYGKYLYRTRKTSSGLGEFNAIEI